MDEHASVWWFVCNWTFTFHNKTTTTTTTAAAATATATATATTTTTTTTTTVLCPGASPAFPSTTSQYIYIFNYIYTNRHLKEFSWGWRRAPLLASTFWRTFHGFLPGIHAPTTPQAHEPEWWAEDGGSESDYKKWQDWFVTPWVTHISDMLKTCTSHCKMV